MRQRFTRWTVHVDRRVFERLGRAANRTGRSRVDLVGAALDDYLRGIGFCGGGRTCQGCLNRVGNRGRSRDVTPLREDDARARRPQSPRASDERAPLPPGA